MRAGLLRHRISFDEPVVTQSASGDELPGWTERWTVWGSIEPLKGREAYSNDQIRDEVDTRMRIRWSPVTANITPKWRARHGAVIYNLQNIAHIETHQREIEIMAQSGLNEG